MALTGVILGAPSSLITWWTLRENRIVSGEGLHLHDALGWPVQAAVLLLWLGCLAAAFFGKKRGAALFYGATTNVVLFLAFFLSGLAARLLLSHEPPAARLSPGAGFWLTIAASYITIFAAKERLKASRLLLHCVSWSGAAACILLLATGWLRDISVLVEFAGREERFIREFFHHVFLVGLSVGIGALLGVSLGVWAARSRAVERPVFLFANTAQTVPSLALFGLLIAPLSALSFAYPFLRELGVRGVGDAPAVIALVIYSLLPIVRNTYAGLKNVETGVVDAGRGMGMSRLQVLCRIEAPLAAPLVLEGIRTASVQSVGLTAVAALIGAGGLGWFIFQGLGQAAADLIILGTIPIMFLALVVDTLMRWCVTLATPKGLS